MVNLLGKVGIITGTTADSIGRACALAMAKAGVKVVVTGRNETGGKITEKIINDAGYSAIYIKHDVT